MHSHFVCCQTEVIQRITLFHHTGSLRTSMGLLPWGWSFPRLLFILTTGECHCCHSSRHMSVGMVKRDFSFQQGIPRGPLVVITHVLSQVTTTFHRVFDLWFLKSVNNLTDCFPEVFQIFWLRNFG